LEKEWEKERRMKAGLYRKNKMVFVISVRLTNEAVAGK
jgi:hypothetical protein